MQPGGLEFRASHAQTLGQHPEHEVVFLLLGVPGNGFVMKKMQIKGYIMESQLLWLLLIFLKSH